MYFSVAVISKAPEDVGRLMDEIWGMDSDTDDHTVNVHINRLRDRVKGNRDFEIVTVRGVGYKAEKLQ